MELAVEIVGGGPAVLAARREWAAKEAYRNVGGYVIELASFESGTGRVSLTECGPDKTEVRRHFATIDDARAEYARLESLLWSRDWVRWVCGALATAGILPTEFIGGIRTG